MSTHAFASDEVDRGAQCRGVNEEGYDIIAKQDAEEALAERNRKS